MPSICLTEREERDAGTHARPEIRRASTFVAKAASVEALLRSGVNDVGAGEIEISRRDDGCPVVGMYGSLVKRAAALGISDVHLSLSNDSDIAIGVAIAVAKGSEHLGGRDPIVGIGVDLVEIERGRDLLEDPLLPVLDHMFTLQELAEAFQDADKVHVSQRLVSIFAVKEAVFKALAIVVSDRRELHLLGSDSKEPGIREIEVLNLTSGHPTVRLMDQTRASAIECNVTGIDVDVLHQGRLIVALAVSRSNKLAHVQLDPVRT
ncbi:MAG: 4'-phosphopantetheinyl transferase superfamily protein [Chloroflexota bacterium]